MPPPGPAEHGSSAASRPRSFVVRVRVFHNLATGGFGPGSYAPGHTVTEVFRTLMPDADPDEICEQVFALINVGHDPDFTDPADPRAVQYRDRGNRSLSVGDVIAIDGSFYACARVGFQPIEIPHILSGSARGTTGLTDAELAQPGWATPPDTGEL